MSIAENAPAPFSAARDVAEIHADRVLEADELLREIKLADRAATYAEMTFFARECGWDEIRARAELRRMNSVLRFEQIAGLPSDRAAAAKEAAKSSEIYESETPKLMAQREKIDAKIRALETDQRLSAKRVQDQTEAVAQLRGLGPEHIAAEVNQRRRTVKATIGKELNEKKDRLNELECCLTPERYPNAQQYIEALRRSCREATTEIIQGPNGGSSQSVRYVMSDKWPSIRAAMQTELAELQPQIEELENQLATELEAAEQSLDYYGQGNHHADR